MQMLSAVRVVSRSTNSRFCAAPLKMNVGLFGRKRMWRKKAKIKGSTVALGIVLLAAGCAPGGPIRVLSYWGTTFERMPEGAAYAWAVSRQEVDPQVVDSGLLDFMRAEIDRGLNELGYAPANGELAPSFFVSLQVGSSLQPSSAGPTEVALMTIETHAPSGRLLWRGWAEGNVDASHPPEVRKAMVERAIRQTLHEFAPARVRR